MNQDIPSTLSRLERMIIKEFQEDAGIVGEEARQQVKQSWTI